MVTSLAIRFARKQLRVGEESMDEWANLFEVAKGAGAEDQAAELVEQFDCLALGILDLLPVLRRATAVLCEAFTISESTALRATVKPIPDLCKDGITWLEKILALIHELESKGFKLGVDRRDFETALSEIHEMAGRAERFLAWLSRPAAQPDPVTVAESRKAFEAGEYQEIGEMIRDLQSGGPQAG